MDLFPIVWLTILMTTALFSSFLGGYAFRRRDMEGAVELSFFLITVALYTVGYALEVAGRSLPNIMVGVKFALFWSSFTAPAFLMFALRFIRQKETPRFAYALVYSLPLAIGLLGLFFDRHGLMYREYRLLEGYLFQFEPGPVHALQLFYLITTSLAGEIMLVFHIRRSRGIIKKQSLLIFMGSVIPSLSALLFPGRLASGLDIQPLVLAVMGLFIGFSLFRYQLLDLTKIGRETAMNKINDALVIIDRNGVILDMNEAALSSPLLGAFHKGGAIPSDEGTGSFLKDLIENSRDDVTTHFTRHQRYYQVFLTPLLSSQKGIEGRIILIRENTDTVKRVNELEQKASTDPLTGISNRREWMENAGKVLVMVHREELKLAVVMFDLDHFKRVNDTYGHPAGDKVLQYVAREIKRSLRKSEFLGRYGGEEFILIGSVRDRKAITLMGERLRRTIEEMVIPWEGHRLQVTASFGMRYAEKLEGVKLEELIADADKALYRAKELGRNRCILSGQ